MTGVPIALDMPPVLYKSPHVFMCEYTYLQNSKCVNLQVFQTCTVQALQCFIFVVQVLFAFSWHYWILTKICNSLSQCLCKVFLIDILPATWGFICLEYLHEGIGKWRERCYAEPFIMLHIMSVCRGAMDTTTQFSESILKWMDKYSSF